MRKLIVAALTAGLLVGGAGAAMADNDNTNNGKPPAAACDGLTNAAGRSGDHRSDNGQRQLDALQAIACQSSGS